MTDAVKRARELLAKASKWPWCVVRDRSEQKFADGSPVCFVYQDLPDPVGIVAYDVCEDDAALIAAAPDLLRELCEEAERLRGIDTRAAAKDLSVEMASHIAAVDRNSNDVAEYIENKLHRLVSRANWYEAAHSAGKAKLIEAALAGVCCSGEPHTCDQEAIAAAEGRTDRVMQQLTATRAALREACEIGIGRGRRSDARLAKLVKLAEEP